MVKSQIMTIEYMRPGNRRGAFSASAATSHIVGIDWVPSVATCVSRHGLAVTCPLRHSIRWHCGTWEVHGRTSPQRWTDVGGRVGLGRACARALANAHGAGWLPQQRLVWSTPNPQRWVRRGENTLHRRLWQRTATGHSPVRKVKCLYRSPLFVAPGNHRDDEHVNVTMRDFIHNCHRIDGLAHMAGVTVVPTVGRALAYGDDRAAGQCPITA